MALNKKPKTINPDEVDPSVYYYDEVYDEMQEDNKSVDQKKEGKSSKEGSKYIQGLLETAELRKNEKEIRVFKKYAKDRERARLDGDEDQDEEVYVSSSYEKKLKEIEVLEAEKNKRLRLERDNMMSFSKQLDANKNTISRPATQVKPVEEVGESEVTKAKDVDDGRTLERKSKQKLNTIEERRKFLRQVLAKRTVGKIYDEALQRYLERKSAYR